MGLWRQFDMLDRQGALVFLRSRAARRTDVLLLTLLIAGGAAAGILLWRALFGDSPLAAVAGGLGVLVALLVFLFAVRYYRQSATRAALVFDRASDRVTREGALLCAASEVDRVEVRRLGADEQARRDVLFLVLSGVRAAGRGTPSAPSPFEADVRLVESGDPAETRLYARRVAEYLGVRLIEP